MKTLIETIHEIEGQTLPELGSTDYQSAIDEETGFELNEEDFEVLRRIHRADSNGLNQLVLEFLEQAGLIQPAQQDHWELTSFANEWMNMIND